jgi:serine/threonine protein kinase
VTHIQMIENVLARCRRCLDNGEKPRFEEIIQKHRDLMPELGIALSKLLEPETVTAVGGSGPVAPTTPEDGAPPNLPGHQIRKHLGRGGFADVWLAWHEQLRQARALKVLRSDRFTPSALAALSREAQTMARLPPHPNRVQIYDLCQADDSSVVVMSFVEGGSLTHGPLPWIQAVHYVLGVAEALQELHAQGLVHRDIKPANIFLDRGRNIAVLGDFGLAAHANGTVGLTGTSGYLAPELVNQPASERSDVFALAATLYYLVVGKSPFPAATLQASLSSASRGLPRPDPQLAALPRGLESALRSGMEPHVNSRADLDEFCGRVRAIRVYEIIQALIQEGQKSVGPPLTVRVSTADPAERTFRLLSTFAGTPKPALVRIQPKSLLRLETTVDIDGHLTVLHFETDGAMDCLLPNPLKREARISANQPVTLTVQVTPSRSADHIAVIWTRGLIGLSPEEWRQRLADGRFLIDTDRGLDFLHCDGTPSRDDCKVMVLTVEQVEH